MRDYGELVKSVRCCSELQCETCPRGDDPVGYIECKTKLSDEAADAIEELLAAMPTLERLIDILSHYFQIGDSDTYELTRVKEAFALGTMSFDDFSEWDEENVSDLAEYIMKNLPAPPTKEDTK